jgi:hypothetical protein
VLKFRIYFDKDAEEVWLKEMSLKGWAFKKFLIGFYIFEECEPGEYNYQIDLLDNWKGDKKDFASFMEESGVEVISQWYRWIYIRKRASEGPLEMYTDSESKIAQYNRIKKFFRLGLLLEIVCFMIEINAAIRTGSSLIWLLTVFIGIIALTFLQMVWKCNWKIEQLKQ